MNKMVINHLDKLFVTSDAATIVKELEVAHPAAKLVVLAAQAQEAEIGDGTNLVRARVCAVGASALLTLLPQVISLAGELLSFAEELIRDGLHPSEILEGYKKASVKVR
jgi:T-complex protein 1 subunit theta